MNRNETFLEIAGYFVPKPMIKRKRCAGQDAMTVQKQFTPDPVTFVGQVGGYLGQVDRFSDRLCEWRDNCSGFHSHFVDQVLDILSQVFEFVPVSLIAISAVIRIIFAETI